MKKVLAVMVALCTIFMLASCGGEDVESTSSDKAHTITNDASTDTWSIYWYLCGSDLETKYGAATSDLEEMMAVALPDNVKIIIQTGGADKWQNDFVSQDYSQRFLYSGNDLELIEQNPVQNMGDSETLQDFLSFCTNNYPADNQVIIFWNHGGGSVSGVAFDEQFEYQSLELLDIFEAFDSVYDFDQSDAEPPFELIGFDACLMATIDTAVTLGATSKYLVASQEIEPGSGWQYTDFLQALADGKVNDGAELGRVICDSYQKSCDELGTGDIITLSVVDLTQIHRLSTAYHNVGVEALTYACEDASFFANYGRLAKSAENYGGNSPKEGYTNMVDLGDLMQKAGNILPENSWAVLDGLEECVVYKVSGSYRTGSSGLSCFFPYDGDPDGVNDFSVVSPSQAYHVLYDYGVNGKMSDFGLQYINEMEYAEVPDEVQQQPQAEIPQFEQVEDLQTVDTLDLEDFPVEIDDDGFAVLRLGSAVSDYLSAVNFQLAYVSVEDSLMLFLGRDNDLDSDWETGVFKDNFRGVWGSIDGNLVYMEIVFEGDDYNIYSVPILLNGEEYNLRVSYSYDDEEYSILGAKKGISDNGMSDKNLLQLKPGDKITTLHYMLDIESDDDEPTQVEVDEIIVTENTAFYEEDLGDGYFVMMFEMVDFSNNSMYSDVVGIVYEDGEISFESL